MKYHEAEKKLPSDLDQHDSDLQSGNGYNVVQFLQFFEFYLSLRSYPYFIFQFRQNMSVQVMRMHPFEKLSHTNHQEKSVNPIHTV